MKGATRSEASPDAIVRPIEKLVCGGGHGLSIEVYLHTFPMDLQTCTFDRLRRSPTASTPCNGIRGAVVGAVFEGCSNQVHARNFALRLTRYFSAGVCTAWPSFAGFRSDAQSVHASRTIMLADLSALFESVPQNAAHDAYRRAIQEDNVLSKRTASTRLWAYKKLRELYALDPEIPVFRGLRTLWAADPVSRPVLALLAAATRDALLRATIGVVASAVRDEEVTRERFRTAIESARGERFSESTMDAVLSHLLTSWTESGHLFGKKSRTRTAPNASSGAVAYALFLGYLTGVRGVLLFSTLWTSVLDMPEPRLHDLAREASLRGWLTYRGIGDVVDITFERLLTASEIELLGANS
jgi:hypothetical protein